MSFDYNACKIPTFWCGKGPVPQSKAEADTYYARAGSGYECLQQGFGAGSAVERTKRLPNNSLQKIKYIGEKYEENFQNENIHNTTDLVREIKRLAPATITRMLKRVVTKSNGSFDKKAFNSVLMYLYHHGVDSGGLPACSRI